MRRLAAFLWMLIAITAVAGATTIVPMSVEELTRAADGIVEARAADSWSQWNPEHTIIFTFTRFEVLKTLKGSLPQQLVVKQPGGVVGSHAVKVPGVRQFQSGESTLLFLRPSAAPDGTYVVVGLMQGNFRMYRTAGGEAAVSNGVPGVSALQNSTVRVYTGTSLALREIERRIEVAK